MNKNLNIMIFSALQYPNGGAAANRHLAIIKGLIELRNNIFFILSSIQKDEIENNYINFIVRKCLFNFDKNNLHVLLFKYITYLKKLKKLVYEIDSKNKIDVIIIFDTNFWEILPVLWIAKKKKIKVIHERTEYPFVVEKKNLIGKLNSVIYNKLIIHKFSGLFVITFALKQYFETKLLFKKPIIVINMIVDPSVFVSSFMDKQLQNQNYIAYCGNMEGDKDGVDILIKAFGKAINNYESCKDLKLKLIGDISNEYLYTRLLNIAKEAFCVDQIEFTGKLDFLKIPNILNNAKALLLARPDNIQAKGGFPTKLGEYLSTGKPVIITRVGEINRFLRDEENVFFAMPDNVDSFAFQIAKVFQNYENALKIGENGKKLIYNVFNYKIQTHQLLDFISKIK